MYIRISAFYKNDGDDGIGITITPNTPDGNLDKVVKAIQEQMQQYREIKVDTGVMLARLLEYVELAHEGELTHDDRLVVALFIAYLEEVGVIPTDNHNGVQFMQIIEPTTQH